MNEERGAMGPLGMERTGPKRKSRPGGTGRLYESNLRGRNSRNQLLPDHLFDEIADDG